MWTVAGGAEEQACLNEFGLRGCVCALVRDDDATVRKTRLFFGEHLVEWRLLHKARFVE